MKYILWYTIRKFSNWIRLAVSWLLWGVAARGSAGICYLCSDHDRPMPSRLCRVFFCVTVMATAVPVLKSGSSCTCSALTAYSISALKPKASNGATTFLHVHMNMSTWTTTYSTSRASTDLSSKGSSHMDYTGRSFSEIIEFKIKVFVGRGWL
jgi:hypothetical protein